MWDYSTLVTELLRFFAVALVVLTLWIGWPMIIGAQWIPTPMKVVKKMLTLADVGPNDTLIDLGSGDGRIIITAALDFNANAIGVEADPIRVLITRLRIRLKNLEEKVDVIWSNFFNTDLSPASVITIYQSTGTNNKLREKLMNELSPGTRVVSYSFIFDGWEPQKVDKVTELYLYEIKHDQT